MEKGYSLTNAVVNGMRHIPNKKKILRIIMSSKYCSGNEIKKNKKV